MTGLHTDTPPDRANESEDSASISSSPQPPDPGALAHTVLVYAVSEPGEWTAPSIAEDLPGYSPRANRQIVADLFTAGLVHVNSFDGRVSPKRAGKDAVAKTT